MNFDKSPSDVKNYSSSSTEGSVVAKSEFLDIRDLYFLFIRMRYFIFCSLLLSAALCVIYLSRTPSTVFATEVAMDLKSRSLANSERLELAQQYNDVFRIPDISRQVYKALLQNSNLSLLLTSANLSEEKFVQEMTSIDIFRRPLFFGGSNGDSLKVSLSLLEKGRVDDIALGIEYAVNVGVDYHNNKVQQVLRAFEPSDALATALGVRRKHLELELSQIYFKTTTIEARLMDRALTVKPEFASMISIDQASGNTGAEVSERVFRLLGLLSNGNSLSLSEVKEILESVAEARVIEKSIAIQLKNLDAIAGDSFRYERQVLLENLSISKSEATPKLVESKQTLKTQIALLMLSMLGGGVIGATLGFVFFTVRDISR